MTIIVWDGKSMAADTGDFCGDTIVSTKREKISIEDNKYLVGTCGLLALRELFIDFLKTGIAPEIVKNWDNFAALVVVLDAKTYKPKELRYYCDSLNYASYAAETKYAIGAAQSIALGALDSGSDAGSVVQICIDRSVWCAGEARTWYFDSVTWRELNP